MASTGTEEVNPIKIGAPGGRLRDRHDGRLRARRALFQRERTGKGPAHRSGDARGRDDAAGLAPDRLLPQRRRAEAARQQAALRDQQRLRRQGRHGDDRRQQPAAAGAVLARGRAARHDQDRQRGARSTTASARRRSSPTSSRRKPPTNGRSISRRGTCRRRGCARWPRRSPTRISKRGGVVPSAFESAPGVDGPFAVPLAAFKFAHGGPSIETPPPAFGADTESVLGELGYAAARSPRCAPRG